MFCFLFGKVVSFVMLIVKRCGNGKGFHAWLRSVVLWSCPIQTPFKTLIIARCARDTEGMPFTKFTQTSRRKNTRIYTHEKQSGVRTLTRKNFPQQRQYDRPARLNHKRIDRRGWRVFGVIYISTVTLIACASIVCILY